MSARSIRILLVIAWVGSFSWLVTTEVLPRWLPGQAAGYRSLIEDAAEVRESWMRILVNGRHMGYTRSFYDLNEESPDPELSMQNNTLINFEILGHVIQIQILSNIVLDSGHRVKEFLFVTSLDNNHYRVNAVRRDRRTYRMTVRMPGEEELVKDIDLPEDAVIFSPAVELSMRKLKPGQVLRIRTYDPLSGSTQILRVKAVKKEAVTVLNTTHDCVRLEAEIANFTFLMWANEAGEVIRQETPFGWTMELCSQEEAVAGVELRAPSSGLIPSQALAPLLNMLKPSLDDPDHD